MCREHGAPWQAAAITPEFAGAFDSVNEGHPLAQPCANSCVRRVLDGLRRKFISGEDSGAKRSIGQLVLETDGPGFDCQRAARFGGNFKHCSTRIPLTHQVLSFQFRCDPGHHFRRVRSAIFQSCGLSGAVESFRRGYVPTFCPPPARRGLRR